VSLVRAATLTIVALAASGWAAVMAVAGLRVVLDYGPGVGPEMRGPVLLGGVAILAVAQFVFMVAVADRLFPAVGGRLIVWLAEMGMFLVALAGIVSAVFLWFRGALT
jgi:hypothetical protein